ncbi:MAG: flagellar hook-length control protein FliK [Lachnospiraceae bacterium]|nr:flagellar hook-length control protein FliK [Lachnospiraceae bacterium]
MTTLPVKNTGSLLPVAEIKQPQTSSEDNSFADVLRQSKGRTEKDSPQPVKNKELVKPERQKIRSKEEKQTVPDREIEEPTTEQVQSAMETLSTMAETVIEDLAQLFEVEPEKVMELMDSLELSGVELMEAGQLQSLLVKLAGETDESFLLTTDEMVTDFNKLIGEVMENVEQAAQEFGMSGEEMLKAVRENMQDGAEKLVQNPIQEEPNLKPETYTVSVSESGEQVTFEMAKDEESGVVKTTDVVSTQNQPELTETKEAGQNGQETAQDKEQDRDSTEHTSHYSGSFSQQIDSFKQLQTELQDVLPSFTSEQVDDIMDQIVERMRVDQSEGLTKLEMQLKPEHLGRVTIEITARNGELTAQITTQNEQVKAAVEAQLTILKENLSDQGLKVESVEVMVETHSFEQSFEGQEHSGQESSSEAKKNRTHRIRLDEINLEDEDALTEEERIVAQLMADRGGTVDYAV